jgi:heat shock protein 90kDa beta
MNSQLTWSLGIIFLFGVCHSIWSVDGTTTASNDGTPDLSENIKSTTGTDSTTLAREEESIKLDGLSVAQMKELREKAEKFAFQAEVDRMMKLIINSLYKNKEIFLRELISNASDALDKIRFLSLTEPTALSATEELSVRIRANKDGKTLHIVDTGVGMTKQELTTNLGTIAKSGTADFMSRMADAKSETESSDLIGQFGVGFYSSFLVADRVTVISKHNDDDQYVWESDANSFSISKDPRGNTLKRGTEVILHLKEETQDYLEQETLKNLVVKYSQFINFPIYVEMTTKEMVDADDEKKEEDKEKKPKVDEDATIEEEATIKEPKKQVEKLVTKWELVNENKPIWTRKPSEVKDEEYDNFYKSFTRDFDKPTAKIHFTAEGEVTFKSILFIPKYAPSSMYHSMNQISDNIKLYVKRVFITDHLAEIMPNYLSFIKGVVDSDDLPLNVSRETLQQSKLIKVIRKKLVRKALEMIKRLPEEEFEKFYKEYSTNIKIGVSDDNSNRTRLSKLLRFWTSQNDEKMTSLESYVSRMKEGQKGIFFIAGESRESLKKSPLVERVLKRGYEVLYLVDAMDEYTINSMSDFDGKKFQNLAKEGLQLPEDAQKSAAKRDALNMEFKDLMEYLHKDVLKDYIERVEMSERLSESPCALVATEWGTSPNMARLNRAQAYKKMQDPTLPVDTEKRILEINPRHPLIKELKKRASDESQKKDTVTRNMVIMMYEGAMLRSGFILHDMSGFAQRMEQMMRVTLNVPLDAKVDEEEEETSQTKPSATEKVSEESSGKEQSSTPSSGSEKTATDSDQKTESAKPKEEL